MARRPLPWRMATFYRYSERVDDITGFAIWAPAYKREFEIDAGESAKAIGATIGSDPSGLCAISPSTFPGSAHGEWGIWVPAQPQTRFEAEFTSRGHIVVDG